MFDSETESELTEKECAALIEVMELKNKLTDMEMQAVYFRRLFSYAHERCCHTSCKSVCSSSCVGR